MADNFYADRVFKILVRAITCKHDAVDGDICCRCGFRVDHVANGRYVFSEDQANGGALTQWLDPLTVAKFLEETDG